MAGDRLQRRYSRAPGLIDTHTHLVADSKFGALDRVAGLSDNQLDAVVTRNLADQLAAGITTVRDLGDLRFAAVTRRNREQLQAMDQNPPSLRPARR